MVDDLTASEPTRAESAAYIGDMSQEYVDKIAFCRHIRR